MDFSTSIVLYLILLVIGLIYNSVIFLIKTCSIYQRSIMTSKTEGYDKVPTAVEIDIEMMPSDKI